MNDEGRERFEFFIFMVVDCLTWAWVHDWVMYRVNWMMIDDVTIGLDHQLNY
jgi:hypothetical protein